MFLVRLRVARSRGLLTLDPRLMLAAPAEANKDRDSDNRQQ
jgi:hypothetical protein